MPSVAFVTQQSLQNAVQIQNHVLTPYQEEEVGLSRHSK